MFSYMNSKNNENELIQRETDYSNHFFNKIMEDPSIKFIAGYQYNDKKSANGKFFYSTNKTPIYEKQNDSMIQCFQRYYSPNLTTSLSSIVNKDFDMLSNIIINQTYNVAIHQSCTINVSIYKHLLYDNLTKNGLHCEKSPVLSHVESKSLGIDTGFIVDLVVEHENDRIFIVIIRPQSIYSKHFEVAEMKRILKRIGIDYIIICFTSYQKFYSTKIGFYSNRFKTVNIMVDYNHSIPIENPPNDKIRKDVANAANQLCNYDSLLITQLEHVLALSDIIESMGYKVNYSAKITDIYNNRGGNKKDKCIVGDFIINDRTIVYVIFETPQFIDSKKNYSTGYLSNYDVILLTFANNQTGGKCFKMNTWG